MIRPPRTGIVVLFFSVLLGAGGFVVYSGVRLALFTREATSVKKAVNKSNIVFAVQNEGAETAGHPLLEVVRGLDFVHDPKALLTFDLAMQTRLRKGKFEELDVCSTGLERTRARFPGGGWELFRMLDMLSNCPGGGGRSEAEWGAHIACFRNWIAIRPESHTAREALAGALIDYAWKARGEGVAGTVTEEGWQLYSERLRQAEEVLRELPTGAHRSPMWFYSILVIDRGLSRPRAEYERDFEAGIEQEPDFFALYTEKAYNLLPRWNGIQGEWERYASDISDRMAGPKGDVLYFFIIRAQCESIGDTEVLMDPNVNWTRVKRGWRALCEAYGGTNNALNEYCLMAGMKGDRDEAAAMLAQIGSHWDPWVWKNHATYDDFQDWVFKREAYAGETALQPWVPKR